MNHPTVEFDKPNGDIVLLNAAGDFAAAWGINRTTTGGDVINVSVVNQMLECAYAMGQANGSSVLRRKISAALE